MNTPLKGIRASIYRADSQEPSDGISSRCREVTVIGCPDGEIFEADDECPAVRIVIRTIFNGERVVHAEPVFEGSEKAYLMFGGTFIHSSDSRFGAAVGTYGAIALHDRRESW